MDKYIGKLVDGRYEMLEIIGVGGMAIVYKARCRFLNRHVAIKVLRDEYAEDEEFCRRFHNESQAVAMLSHNNIVSVYDVSKNEDFQYIVMELLDGITLKEYLKKNGVVSWKQTLDFASQIAKALMHAHQKGIIHQDIKPQNIIVTQDGTIKVTDFGIAKICANQETKVIKEAIGSVHYISPEQAKGSTIDTRTDIYSLGIVMYEMLTGTLPFEGETPLSIVIQHINAVPLLPGDQNNTIPKAVDKIVMKSMCPTLDKRYQSASELYNDIQGILDDPDINFDYNIYSMRNDKEFNFDETQSINYNKEELRGMRSRSLSKSLSEKKHTNKNKKIGMSPTVFAAIFVGVIFIGAVYLSFNLVFSNNNKNKIVVPEFIGKHVDKIFEDDQYKNYLIVEAGEKVVDSNEPDGTVMDQKPKSGQKVDKNTEIVLTVAGTIKNMKIIPDVVELSKERALRILDQEGILNEVKEEYSENIKEGNVVRTSPGVNSEIEEDQTVTVYVSRGQEKTLVKMPKIIDMDKASAKKELERVGLSLGSVKEAESKKAKGTVVSQSVAANVEIISGTAIDIEVSLGPSDDPPKNPSQGNNGNQSPSDNPNQSTDSSDTTAVADDKIATVMVTLPEGKDFVTVRINMGSKTIYEKKHQTSEKQVNVDIKGTGSLLITVYIDEELWAEEIITFK